MAVLGSLIDTTRADAKHFEAIGRFIARYALAEGGAHALARSLSGMRDLQARAVFGGMRLSDLSERIRALLTLKGDSTAYARGDECLKQLSYIAQQRHNVVHRLIEIGAGHIIATNFLVAKGIEDEETPYTLDQLSAMTADCNTIFLRLTDLSSLRLVGMTADEVEEFWREPWLHGRPAPKRTGIGGTRIRKSGRRLTEPSRE